MDDHWKVKLPRDRNLGPKTVSLKVPRRIIVVVVESGLANRNTFRVVGRRADGVRVTGLRLGSRVMRMDAGAEPDIVKCLGNAPWLIRRCQFHANRDDAAHTRLTRTGENAGKVLGKLRVVEMGVAVDDHEPPCSSFSSI